MRVRALAVAWLLVPGLASAQPYTTEALVHRIEQLQAVLPP